MDLLWFGAGTIALAALWYAAMWAWSARGDEDSRDAAAAVVLCAIVPLALLGAAVMVGALLALLLDRR